jgi:hypothetical protein
MDPPVLSVSSPGARETRSRERTKKTPRDSDELAIEDAKKKRETQKSRARRRRACIGHSAITRPITPTGGPPLPPPAAPLLVVAPPPLPLLVPLVDERRVGLSDERRAATAAAEWLGPLRKRTKSPRLPSEDGVAREEGAASGPRTTVTVERRSNTSPAPRGRARERVDKRGRGRVGAHGDLGDVATGVSTLRGQKRGCARSRHRRYDPRLAASRR